MSDELIELPDVCRCETPICLCCALPVLNTVEGIKEREKYEESLRLRNKLREEKAFADKWNPLRDKLAALWGRPVKISKDNRGGAVVEFMNYASGLWEPANRVEHLAAVANLFEEDQDRLLEDFPPEVLL